MKIDTRIAIFLAAIILGIGFFLGRYFEFSKTPKVIEYACSDKKTVAAQYYKEKVHIGLSDEREYTLPQVDAVSGKRYANKEGSLVFWNKDNGVFFQEDSLITYSNCLEAGK